MIRSAASKVMWVGRIVSMVFGLALVLALMVGVASMAFGANGDFFKVGKANFASAVSTLSKSGAGPALSLKVGRGKPLAVNSDAKVDKLNADKLDGKNASQIGVNGYERIRDQSAFDSTAHKVAIADCPAGKRIIGGGAQIFPSLLDSSRDSAPIVIRGSYPGTGEYWVAIADEISGYGYSWWVSATAICAN